MLNSAPATLFAEERSVYQKIQKCFIMGKAGFFVILLTLSIFYNITICHFYRELSNDDQTLIRHHHISVTLIELYRHDLPNWGCVRPKLVPLMTINNQVHTNVRSHQANSLVFRLFLGYLVIQNEIYLQRPIVIVIAVTNCVACIDPYTVLRKQKAASHTHF